MKSKFEETKTMIEAIMQYGKDYPEEALIYPRIELVLYDIAKSLAIISDCLEIIVDKGNKEVGA